VAWTYRRDKTGRNFGFLATGKKMTFSRAVNWTGYPDFVARRGAAVVKPF
jgi:hypothetical protein